MAGDAYFKLQTSKNHDAIEARIKELYWGKYFTPDMLNGSAPFSDWESRKWHSMIEDCVTVSKEFPDTHIIIDKKENDWDNWENPFFKYHFKNGKYQIQKSKIVWDNINI